MFTRWVCYNGWADKQGKIGLEMNAFERKLGNNDYGNGDRILP